MDRVRLSSKSLFMGRGLTHFHGEEHGSLTESHESEQALTRENWLSPSLARKRVLLGSQS
jgi:hypothetical protein